MQSTYDSIRWYKFTPEEKENVIAKAKAAVAKEKVVKSAWIFGGLTRRNIVRDVDIAVVLEPELSFKHYLSLGARIETEVGIPVDVVDLAEAPEPLKANIAKANIKIK